MALYVLASLCDNIQSFLLLERINVTDHVLLHDARLVPGDVRDGVAEQAGVVQAQARDAGHHGPRDDVGAVVLAPDTHLDDRHVHILSPEDVESEDCEELEVRRPVLLVSVFAHFVIHIPEVGCELVLETCESKVLISINFK